jgi:hypothetical protein
MILGSWSGSEAFGRIFRVKLPGERTMFESLEERIELDESHEATKKQRMMHYLTIMAISVVVVGGIAVIFQYVR